MSYAARLSAGLLLLPGFLWTLPTPASCGVAFCTLNTAWEVQGAPTEPGLRLDLRFEYIDQDQPRAGRRKVAVGEIRQHHDEQRTLNRNTVATLDYAPSENWNLSLQLPYVRRDHWHIHNHHGVQHFDSWEFDELGDIKLLARLRFPNSERRHGVVGGFKLPTGKTDIRNMNGDLAERSLQPGTGTVDVVVGYYINTLELLGNTPTRLFAQAQAQAPTKEHEGFRPGTQLNVDAGIAYPATGTFTALTQLNVSLRRRDHGRESEPANSGGTFAWISPGIGYTVGRSTQLYAFVQLPIYQRVNGVQLTADQAFVAGVSTRF